VEEEEDKGWRGAGGGGEGEGEEVVEEVRWGGNGCHSVEVERVDILTGGDVLFHGGLFLWWLCGGGIGERVRCE